MTYLSSNSYLDDWRSCCSETSTDSPNSLEIGSSEPYTPSASLPNNIHCRPPQHSPLPRHQIEGHASGTMRIQNLVVTSHSFCLYQRGLISCNAACGSGIALHIFHAVVEQMGWKAAVSLCFLYSSTTFKHCTSLQFFFSVRQHHVQALIIT